jgi:hypothetical protein
MKRLFVVLLLSISKLAIAQSIEEVHHFQFSVPGERIILFDVANEHCLLSAAATIQTFSGQAVVAEEGEVDVLFLTDENMNILWQASTVGTASRIFDAKLCSDGFYVTSGANSSVSDGMFNNEVIPAGQIMITKIGFNGEIIWIKTGYEKFRKISFQSAVDLNDNFYLVGDIINNNTPLFFAGEELVSTAIDLQFPDNMCLLKFSSSGEDIWGRALNGDDSNSHRFIKVDQNFNIFILGTFTGTTIPFANDSIQQGRFLISYAENGSERWALSSPESDGVLFQRISLHNDTIYLTITSNMNDGFILDGQFIDTICDDIMNQHFVTVKLQNNGEIQDWFDVGCTTFLNSQIEAYPAQSDELIFIYKPAAGQSINGMDFGDSSNSLVMFKTGLSFEQPNTPFIFESPNSGTTVASMKSNSNYLYFSVKLDAPLTMNNQLINELEGSPYIIQMSLTTNTSEEIYSSPSMLYPNPTLQTICSNISPIGNYVIFDNLGKIIQQGTTFDHCLDVSTLQKGNYFLVTDSYSEKFMKEK